MEGISRLKKLLVGAATFAITYPFLTSAVLPLYDNRTTRIHKTVIVTGATGNLGRATVAHLAIRKARVIMACRDMELCKAIRREIVMHTNHKGILCRHLDLEDIDSINRFADDMIKNEPHIDVLINNAAVKEVKEKQLTKYGIEKNYFVNFLGPYLLTFRLLDKLKESGRITRDSRIINVIGTPKRSWDVQLDDINFEKRKYNKVTAYRQSKLALAYFTILLDEFIKKDKEMVFVFGTSPCYKKLSESLVRPIGIREQMINLAVGFISADPVRVSSLMIKCALDPKMDRNSSGKLYSYFLTHWGWGQADKDILKAKAVWNEAAQMLLKIKDVGKNSGASG